MDSRLQVSSECRERATLLAAVWAHSSALVELRCTLASRHALAHQEAVSGALREEAFAAASAVKYDPATTGLGKNPWFNVLHTARTVRRGSAWPGTAVQAGMGLKQALRRRDKARASAPLPTRCLSKKANGYSSENCCERFAICGCMCSNRNLHYLLRRRLQGEVAELEAKYSREAVAEERCMLRAEVAAAHREKQRQEAAAAAASAALRVSGARRIVTTPRYADQDCGKMLTECINSKILCSAQSIRWRHLIAAVGGIDPTLGLGRIAGTYGVSHRASGSA